MQILMLAAGATLLVALYVIGGKLTKSSAGKAGPRPLDYFKTLEWVSTMGHMLGGMVFVFFIDFYRGTHAAVITSAILAVGATAKEIADVYGESDEDWWSSLQDLAGWLMGVVLAWGNILLATHLGKLS